MKIPSNGNITIYNADCRKVLPTFDDRSFDLVLTDFPYGNNTNYDGYEDTKENLSQLVIDVMPEILRISKRALITCGVANINCFPEPDWILSWVTPAGAGSGPWGFSCWQPILAYGKDPYLQMGKGRRPDTFIHTEKADKTIGMKQQGSSHPCPKPESIWTKLLLRGSVSVEDKILDPFMGSGTTLWVAKKTGRCATGIEISKKYCEVAEERINRQGILI